MSKKPSPAIQLLDLAWANCNKATDHSWERLNHSMRKALSLAIGAGFDFEEGDMAYIMSSYRTGYWIGESSEWVYASAIAVENMAAIKSYEAMKKREPFIADEVSLTSNGGYTHSQRCNRNRERLAVGFEFKWQGQKVRVTSFAGDQSYITACSYKRIKGSHGYSEKLDKRFNVTRAEIIAGRAMNKERKSMLNRLMAAADKSEERGTNHG